MSTNTSIISSGGDKRQHLQSLIREFQGKLGNNWDKYHESLSLYLVGKLSRHELTETITPILKNGLVNYHNKLLLFNLANSLGDSSTDNQSQFASFWNKKATKPKNIKSTQYEKFKQNIMSLPIKERRRIKNITKDSGKKNKLFASITLTRQALLPKIPMIQDKEQQQLQVNNLVQWQQDVVNGINTPIATQNFELPDYDSLSRRIIMTMRNYGLTGGVNAQILEVILLGLETYLNNIIEASIDVARYRQNKYTSNDFVVESQKDNNKRKQSFHDENPSKKSKVSLNINDLYDTFEMYPHLIEYCGPKYKLPNVMLQNDDWDSNEPDYVLPHRVNLLNGVDIHNGSSRGDVNKENNAEEPHEHDKPKANDEKSNKNSSPVQIRNDNHIGTTDELKWVLHDLYTAS